MKAIKFGKSVVELADDCTWLTRDTLVKELLDEFSREVLEEISTSDGEPKAIVLQRTAAEFGVEAIDTDKQEHQAEGVVY